jgi:rhodanese-related sulfurtransferase
MDGKTTTTARRAFVALAVIGAAALGAAAYLPRVWAADGPTLGADEAYRRALAGEILLVDIRRPDEWAATGIGAGAVALDMREAGFLDDLKSVAAQRPGVPVALICARGGRSARLAARLVAEGFADVIDVPEGMLGSRAGPGWVARGLPVTRN